MFSSQYFDLVDPNFNLLYPAQSICACQLCVRDELILCSESDRDPLEGDPQAHDAAAAVHIHRAAVPEAVTIEEVIVDLVHP